MTIQGLKSRIIELLGEKHLHECNGRTFLQFDGMDDLSIMILPNFSLEELLTKNQIDTFTRLELGVLVLLQTIRQDFGYPVIVSSSYRSKAYNKSVNGATSSRHEIGDALDSHPKNMARLAEYKKLITKMDIQGGMGLYPSFVHVDTRPNKARW